ncbi:hypothetical protein NKH18_15185 [Streptomyces sp. M10(2022)]
MTLAPGRRMPQRVLGLPTGRCPRARARESRSGIRAGARGRRISGGEAASASGARSGMPFRCSRLQSREEAVEAVGDGGQTHRPLLLYGLVRAVDRHDDHVGEGLGIVGIDHRRVYAQLEYPAFTGDGRRDQAVTTVAGGLELGQVLLGTHHLALHTEGLGGQCGEVDLTVAGHGITFLA